MKRILSITLMLSLLVLGGCREAVPDYRLEAPTTEPATQSALESTNVITTQPKEHREYATYPVEKPTDNVIGNTHYDSHARAIYYYDVDLQRTVYLCSQPNCPHNSENCTAYLGGEGNSTYIVEGDLAYALVDRQHTDGQLLFLERNLITGDTRILWDLTPEENVMRDVRNFSLCGQEAFLTFRQAEVEYVFEGSYTYAIERNIVQYSYAIDLITGERELLIEAEIPFVQGYHFYGSSIVPEVCTRDYLLINEISFSQEIPMTEEDYYKQNPEGDYMEYSQRVFRDFSIEAHYSVNRKTGEKKRICGSTYEANLEHCGYRDRNLVFTDADTVCVYNGYTGEVTPYFELDQDKIGLLTLYDGRIFYNLVPEDEESEVWSFFWYDMTTGETRQFQKGIPTMVFSIHGETADYFYGLLEGRNGKCFISKQDFYNENYDAAF